MKATDYRFNKRSPTQVVRFWGRSMLKLKSGKGRRNSGTNYYCSEFHGGFNGAKTGFLSLTVLKIFVMTVCYNRIIYFVVKYFNILRLTNAFNFVLGFSRLR